MRKPLTKKKSKMNAKELTKRNKNTYTQQQKKPTG